MEWQSIESAPKEQDVLVYRADAGIMMGKITCLSEIMSDKEMEQSELSEEDLHQDNWFIASPTIVEMVEGDEIPTHWMPLPKEPK